MGVVLEVNLGLCLRRTNLVVALALCHGVVILDELIPTLRTALESTVVSPSDESGEKCSKLINIRLPGTDSAHEGVVYQSSGSYTAHVSAGISN